MPSTFLGSGNEAMNERMQKTPLSRSFILASVFSGGNTRAQYLV